MPTTQEEIDQERAAVDDLREQIAEEKAKVAIQAAEAGKDYEKETLVRQREALEAELASLRGEPSPVPQPEVDGYIVPMGTVAIDTDVVSVDMSAVEGIDVPAGAIVPGDEAEAVAEAPAPPPPSFGSGGGGDTTIHDADDGDLS